MVVATTVPHCYEKNKEHIKLISYYAQVPRVEMTHAHTSKTYIRIYFWNSQRKLKGKNHTLESASEMLWGVLGTRFGIA